MTTAEDQNTRPYRDIAATHIRTLSTLNAAIPSLLTTSATTFSNLTNAPINPPTLQHPATAPDTLSRRQAAISTTANQFFTSVLELRTALHAQIDDLEKQGVIPADEVKYRAAAPQQGGQGQQVTGKDSEAKVTNNGLGNFDIGMLNAKAGQRGGDEILERVKKALQELATETEGEDEDMIDG